MATCSYFGHSRNCDYSIYYDQIKNYFEKLIIEQNVSEFYTGYRGDFDRICTGILDQLKSKYSIKIFLVLAYMPGKVLKDDEGEEENALPDYIDETVYLLERTPPKRFAIIESNKAIVNISDFILCGVYNYCGGANIAIEYAEKKKKNIYYLIDRRNPNAQKS